MKPEELYELIKKTEYTKSGDDVDWAVVVDDFEKVVRLLFEESTTKRDWHNNFDFPVKIYKRQESCMLIARGWGNAWKSCNDLVMDALIKEKQVHKDYRVEICGWSYGGAMSVLAAEDYCYRTHDKASVITFGAPKPLWGRKTWKYMSGCVTNAMQYAHVNDVVPLCIPLPGYKMINKVKVGSDFCILKLFRGDIYHCCYGNADLYKNL